MYGVLVHGVNTAGATYSPKPTSNCFCHLLLLNMSSFTGTHDVIAATVLTGDSETIVMTQYFEEFSASGALYVLVFLTDEEEVDLTRSVLLALDVETSRDYTLPFSLSPGGYRVFVYDIEQDGTLSSGVNYPAVADETSRSSKTMSESIHPVVADETNWRSKTLYPMREGIRYYECVQIINIIGFQIWVPIWRVARSPPLCIGSVLSVLLLWTPRQLVSK